MRHNGRIEKTQWTLPQIWVKALDNFLSFSDSHHEIKQALREDVLYNKIVIGKKTTTMKTTVFVQSAEGNFGGSGI